jgi:hypothetical protein
MKKAFAYICLCLLLINQSCQQAKGKIFPLENSLLWEISGNGLKSPSYLFGTNHLLGKDFANSLVGISKKFNTCKAVVGEVVIDSAALPQLKPYWLSTYNPLTNIFTSTQFDEIDKVFDYATHRRLMSLNGVKPTAIELLIVKSIAPKTISSTNPSLDIYFQNEGKKHGYVIIGLETIDFQDSLIFNSPIDDQKEDLLFLVKNIDSVRKNINMLFKLYKAQNLMGIDKLMASSESVDPDENDKLLKDRDLKWINEIPAIIKKQPAFIAVGLGHLIREYGLINQLRLRGYTVKPVKI